MITKFHYEPVKGHNSTKADNPDLKKICAIYYVMRNPYMKFQNCILINFVTDARMNGRTDKAKAICPFNFSKVGGITKGEVGAMKLV